MMRRYGMNGFREIAKYAWDKSRFYRQAILDRPHAF